MEGGSAYQQGAVLTIIDGRTVYRRTIYSFFYQTLAIMLLADADKSNPVMRIQERLHSIAAREGPERRSYSQDDQNPHQTGTSPLS